MLNIGLLGASEIAPAAILRPASRREDVQVLAVAARDASRALQYASRHNIPYAHASYRELLDDPAIDVVYVGLPPSEHADWSIAALEAGKHVLCEKPFAMNAAEAQRMADAARAAGLQLIEAFHDHYHPLAARTAELAAELGRLRNIEAVFLVQNPFAPGAIRHEPSLGGGALMDLGVYPLHGVRALLGEEPIDADATAVFNPAGADESIDATLIFPSGATARVRASMAHDYENWLRVEGERGTLTVTGIVFPSAGHTIALNIDGVLHVETVAGRETYDHQLDALVSHLSTGSALPTGAVDAVANMRAVDLIRNAAGESPWQ